VTAARARALQTDSSRWVTDRECRRIGAAAFARLRATKLPSTRQRRDQGFCCGFLILAIAACATRPSPPPPSAEPASVDALAAAIEATQNAAITNLTRRFAASWRPKASRDAEACLAREPQAAPCLYWRAVALGLEARAHPTRAGEMLSNMLATLGHAESADPNYDEAGPARVRALVLVRAPGCPWDPAMPRRDWLPRVAQ